MTHNYYIYGDPDNGGSFTWICWDMNEAFSGQRNRSHQLGLGNINGEQWPLIGYLMADPVYKALYNKYVSELKTTAFPADATIQQMEALHKMITPYVTGADGEQPGYTMLTNASQFATSFESLKMHVRTRHTAIDNYLKTVP
jgi:spore coat protein CotH